MKASWMIGLILSLAAPALSCQPADDGPELCEAPTPARFGGVQEDEDVDRLNISGLHFSREFGTVRGFRDNGKATLLLIDTQLDIEAPCDATTFEVVLDQTERALDAELYARPPNPDKNTPLYSESSYSAELLEDLTFPYERWTLVVPTGKQARVLRLSNLGSAGTSTLIESITVY